METIKEKRTRNRKQTITNKKAKGEWKDYLKKCNNSERYRHKTRRHISQMTIDYCSGNLIAPTTYTKGVRLKQSEKDRNHNKR